MRARTVSILGVVGALGLSACGGSGPKGFAAQSPAAIIAASVSAVKQSTSYVLSGDGGAGAAKLSLSLIYSGPRAVRLDVSASAGHIEVILAQSQSYLKADTAFWTKEANAAAARVYADRWFKVDPSKFGTLTKDITHASPADFATCMSADITQPRLVRTTRVSGEPAVELSYTTRVGAASRIWIRQAAPHYPLRVVNADTGSRADSAGICDSSGSGGAGGTVSFTHWNGAPAVSAPTHASTLP